MASGSKAVFSCVVSEGLEKPLRLPVLIHLQADAPPALLHSYVSLIEANRGIVLESAEAATIVVIVNEETPNGAKLIEEHSSMGEENDGTTSHVLVDHSWITACIAKGQFLGPPTWGGFKLPRSPVPKRRSEVEVFIKPYRRPGPKTASVPGTFEKSPSASWTAVASSSPGISLSNVSTTRLEATPTHTPAGRSSAGVPSTSATAMRTRSRSSSLSSLSSLSSFQDQRTAVPMTCAATSLPAVLPPRPRGRPPKLQRNVAGTVSGISQKPSTNAISAASSAGKLMDFPRNQLPHGMAGSLYSNVERDAVTEYLARIYDRFIEPDPAKDAITVKVAWAKFALEMKLKGSKRSASAWMRHYYDHKDDYIRLSKLKWLSLQPAVTTQVISVPTP